MIEIFWSIAIAGKTYNHRIHCGSFSNAKRIMERLGKRMLPCGLWKADPDPEKNEPLCIGGNNYNTGRYQLTWL